MTQTQRHFYDLSHEWVPPSEFRIVPTPKPTEEEIEEQEREAEDDENKKDQR